MTLVGVFILYRVITWPDVAGLVNTRPETTAFIETARARGVDVHWRWVPYDNIADNLKTAVLVAEDMSFFSHNGFDTHELQVALREALERKRVRGASTITQQLAKNLWLSPSRSPLRKIEEAILTAQLERFLEKKRILEIYLNVVEFGPGLYGAEAASIRYFGRPADSLSSQQAAQLAASLPRPSSWHPGCTSRGYAKSVNRIRARMDQARWIDQLL